MAKGSKKSGLKVMGASLGKGKMKGFGEVKHEGKKHGGKKR